MYSKTMPKWFENPNFPEPVKKLLNKDIEEMT